MTRTMFVFAAEAVVLGIIGASFGWMLAAGCR